MIRYVLGPVAAFILINGSGGQCLLAQTPKVKPTETPPEATVPPVQVDLISLQVTKLPRDQSGKRFFAQAVESTQSDSNSHQETSWVAIPKTETEIEEFARRNGYSIERENPPGAGGQPRNREGMKDRGGPMSEICDEHLPTEVFDVFEVVHITRGTPLEHAVALDFVPVAPGQTSEIHRHNGPDSVLLVIEGSGTLNVGGSSYSVRKGTRMIIGKGIFHGVRTEG